MEPISLREVRVICSGALIVTDRGPMIAMVIGLPHKVYEMLP